MNRLILCVAVLLLTCSTASAAARLSDFPVGMAEKEAVGRGVVKQDAKGGSLSIEFGGEVWPAAFIFEDGKLAYVALKGNGQKYMAAAEEGLWQLGWLIIYATTDKNIIFDAVALSAKGVPEEQIGEAYGQFQEQMQRQKYTKSASIYISERVWVTFKNSTENPVIKYPDAVVCNITTDGEEINIVFSTFGYIEKVKNARK